MKALNVIVVAVVVAVVGIVGEIGYKQSIRAYDEMLPLSTMKMIHVVANGNADAFNNTQEAKTLDSLTNNFEASKLFCGFWRCHTLNQYITANSIKLY